LGKEKETTLGSDEPRKNGVYKEVLTAQDKAGKSWILGLRDMETKASQNCLDTLKEIMSDSNTSTKTDIGSAYLRTHPKYYVWPGCHREKCSHIIRRVSPRHSSNGVYQLADIDIKGERFNIAAE
jgi:hypothetical protein